MQRRVRVALRPQPTIVVSSGRFRLVSKVATLPRVSVVATEIPKFGACRHIFHASFGSRIFNIRILTAETPFEVTETGST
jgi:hypothetical protein